MTLLYLDLDYVVRIICSMFDKIQFSTKFVMPFINRNQVSAIEEYTIKMYVKAEVNIYTKLLGYKKCRLKNRKLDIYWNITFVIGSLSLSSGVTSESTC